MPSAVHFILSLAASVAVGADPIIPIGAREEVVFLGDSITEQHRWSGFVEAWLLTRYPDCVIRTTNLGWSGERAVTAAGRWERDVAGIVPTLVFAAYGMNDGGYRQPEARTTADYRTGITRLIDLATGAGARTVLIAPPPVDISRPRYRSGRTEVPDYNATLGGFARLLAELAGERGVAQVDWHTPQLELQRSLQATGDQRVLADDGIHPDLPAALALAWQVCRRLPGARPVGRIVLAPHGVRSDGGIGVESLPSSGSGRCARIRLPFLPLPVPSAARPLLDRLSIQAEGNALTLSAPDLNEGAWDLLIDGRLCGTWTEAQLAAGIDIALSDQAPWAVQGARLWELGQVRHRLHLERWRQGTVRPADAATRTLAAWDGLLMAQDRVIAECWEQMRAAACPVPAVLELVPSATLAIAAAECSPAVAFPATFAQVVAPEDGTEVAWTRFPWPADGLVDFTRMLGQAQGAAATVRLRLHAAAAARLRLDLGSDDGLLVILDGRRIHSNDIARRCTPGEDRVELDLAAGDHELLLRVDQRGGGWALSLTARTVEGPPVRALAP